MRHSVQTPLLSLVLLVATGGCYTYTGWSASKGRHSTVYTDATTKHRFSQEWIEQSFAAYKALFPDIPVDNVEVLWVGQRQYPGGNARIFAPWAPAPKTSTGSNLSRGCGVGSVCFPEGAWAIETVPGNGRIGRDGLIILETRDEMDAARQLAHVFISKGIKNAPVWLQLGLARYMAKHRVHRAKDRWMVCFGSEVFDERVESGFRLPPAMLAQQGAGPGDRGGSGGGIEGTFDGPVRNILLPLDDILGGDWYQYDTDLRDWFEFSSYALVHYLIHGKGKFHNERFKVFMRAIMAGTSSEEALALAYPHITADEWDEQLNAYVRPTNDRSVRAQTRTLRNGLCFRVPPLDYASDTPKRTPVAEADIREVIEDIERLPLLTRFASWYPEDVVRAEAKPRKGRPRDTGGRGEGGGEGNGSGGSGRGGGGRDQGSPGGRVSGSGGLPGGGPAPLDDGSTPFLRETAPPPIRGTAPPPRPEIEVASPPSAAPAAPPTAPPAPPAPVQPPPPVMDDPEKEALGERP